MPEERFVSASLSGAELCCPGFFAEDAGAVSDGLNDTESDETELTLSPSADSSSSGSGMIVLWKRSIAIMEVVIAISATLKM